MKRPEGDEIMSRRNQLSNRWGSANRRTQVLPGIQPQLPTLSVKKEVLYIPCRFQIRLNKCTKNSWFRNTRKRWPPPRKLFKGLVMNLYHFWLAVFPRHILTWRYRASKTRKSKSKRGSILTLVVRPMIRKIHRDPKVVRNQNWECHRVDANTSSLNPRC